MEELKATWYDGLRPEQRAEFGKWYNNWLNVTDTYKISKNLIG